MPLKLFIKQHVAISPSEIYGHGYNDCVLFKTGQMRAGNPMLIKVRGPCRTLGNTIQMVKTGGFTFLIQVWLPECFHAAR